jgi:hypothetical protein
MSSLKLFLFTLFVLFICIGLIHGNSINTCGNLGTASPLLAEECTGAKYQNGTCCFVENAANNVSYCVLLLGTPRNDAIENFQTEINIPSISVDCHSEFLTASLFLFILAMFL